MNKSKHDALVSFCQAARDRGVGFDRGALMRACLPFVFMPDDDTKTFCSKFVVDALQYAGVPEAAGLDGRTTTPSSLFRHVREKMRTYAIVTATPARLRAFQTKPPALGGK